MEKDALLRGSRYSPNHRKQKRKQYKLMITSLRKMKVRKKSLFKKGNLLLNLASLLKSRKPLFTHTTYPTKHLLFLRLRPNISSCNSSLWGYSNSSCKCSNKDKFLSNNTNSCNSNCTRLEGRIQYLLVKSWLSSLKDRFFSSKCYKLGNKCNLFSNSCSSEECQSNSKLPSSSNRRKCNSSHNQVQSGLLQDIQ